MGALLRSRAFLIALLTAAVALTYAPSLRNDFVIWDDNSLVTQNPLTQHLSPASVAGAFTSYDPELYVPLTIVSFEVEHAMFGFSAFHYHFDNLLLHAIVAALVLLFLEQLGLRRVAAFAGAALFALHPLNTEAVAWVSARKDLLSALFSLGALLAYLRMRDDGRTRWFWMTTICFLLALLSKPVSIVLPAIFLLLDWKDHGRITREDGKRNMLFIMLSALFLVIGLYGKRRNIAAVGAWQTVLLAIKSAAFALSKFLWPAGLSPIYLQTDPITLALPQFLIPTLVLIVIGIVAIVSLKKTRIVVFSFAFFFILLLPSFSNFAKDRDIYFFSDRYVYLAQIGLLFLLGSGIDAFLRKRATVTRVVLPLAGIPLLGLLAWTAHAQSLTWKDSETLYRDAITKNDRSVVMHYNLALLEQSRGNRPAALAEYEKVLALDPHNAKTHVNLGMDAYASGDSVRALGLLREAEQEDPTAPEASNDIGSILMDGGDVDGAMAEFAKAIAIAPNFAQAHVNMAAALGRKGRYEEGLQEYAKAFALDPRLGQQMPEVEAALKAMQK